MHEETGHGPQPPADELDWEPVMAWCREHAGDADVGHWEDGQPLGDGVSTFPYAVLSESARQLVTLLHRSQVVAPFDWGAWMQAAGRDLLASGDALQRADLEDCRCLLVALVRGDRFSEGLLLEKLRDGTVRAILERVANLLDGAHGQTG